MKTPGKIGSMTGVAPPLAVGKPVALIPGMNDAAYDISHLLELDLVAPVTPERCSSQPVIARPEPSGVACAQAALAHELLQMAGHHEEMIRQYMSISDDAVLDAGW